MKRNENCQLIIYNMSFLKRLSFFLFGLSIGVVILIFISNKKDTRFNYMPNKRVLNDIHKKKWVFKDSNQMISKNDFLKNYDVNFSKSNVELDSCKIYFIESKESRFEIKNCKNRAFFNKTN